MISEAITIELITTFGVIVVAILQLVQNRNSKRDREDNERYRKKREEEEATRIERDAKLYALVFADSTGTEVLLHQAHGDHLNGNVEAALSDIRDAKAELNAVCNFQMAKI